MLTKVPNGLCEPELALPSAEEDGGVCRVFASELLGSDGMIIIQYRGVRYLLTTHCNPGELELVRL